MVEFRCQAEEGKIVCEQFPVEGDGLEGGVFNQQVNITPIPAMTGWIVDRSLDLEADEIFDVNDRQAQATDKFEHFCVLEHAEGRAAECM